jgi:hypothetical protein
MLRKKALAAASAGVLVLATGAVSVAALSGVRILGFNAPSSASAVPAVSGGPASVLVVNKKHVVTKKGAPGQPDTTILVDDTVPAAAEVVDPGSGAPLVVRAAAAPVDAPAAPDEATSTPSVAQPSSSTAAPTTPSSPAAGSSGQSPARPAPATGSAAPSAATTATTTKLPDTTPKPATVVTTTTIVAAATTTTTTAAATTTTTTAAPVVTTTTTVAKPAKVTSSGQVIPTSWQLSSSFLSSGKPIPPYPASCRNGQLEDNGVWNCG